MNDTKALIAVARSLLARPKDFCGRDVMADLVEALEAAEGENAKLRALVAALDERKNAERHLARMSTIIAWQLQASGAALENQKLRAVLKSVEEIVLEAPELNMSNFDEDQVSSLNEAMISICGILLQESARKDQEGRHG